MTLNEIAKRNYAASVRRGQISNSTTLKDFIDKIREELNELEASAELGLDTIIDETELADITLVCFSFAKHFRIDLPRLMEEKTLYNEQRTD